MGNLYVVGIGTGNYEDLTIKAFNTLNLSDFIYCDELMFEKIKRYFDISKIIKNEYTKTKTRCVNAINHANAGKNISIVGSGDTGIYGISSIVYEEAENLKVNINIKIISGITSAIEGSSILGSPITQDFAVISLSDNLANKEELRDRLEAVAKTDFVIIFYSPSNPTKNNLLLAREILLKYRSLETIVGIVNHIGENNQTDCVTNIAEMMLQEIDWFSTIYIGNNKTQLTKSKKMITPLINKKRLSS